MMDKLTVVLAAMIVAIGIFGGAQRIADEVSFEGEWDSCVKTFNRSATQNALRISGSSGEAMCFAMFRKPN
jgi:hypothetical protein